MKTYIFISIALLFVSTSCETKKTIPFVDTRANIYAQLEAETNEEVKSYVQRVEAVEMFQEFKKPLKTLRSTDEIEIMSALAEVFIENEAIKDSVNMTTQNTLFMYKENNTSYKSSTENSNFSYYVSYQTNGYNTDNVKMLWERKMFGAVQLPYEKDSVTLSEKKNIENNYHKGISKLKELAYVILINDVLLVPAKIDKKNGGFYSGYIATNAYIYDAKTLDKIGQNMIITSSSGEISYRKGSLIKYNDRDINAKLRLDLMNQKKKAIDSTYGFIGLESIY